MVPKHTQDVGSARWVIVRNLMVIPQIVLSLQYIFWFFSYSQTSRQQTTINSDPLIQKVEATLQTLWLVNLPPVTYPPQKWGGGWLTSHENELSFGSLRWNSATLQLLQCNVAAVRLPPDAAGGFWLAKGLGLSLTRTTSWTQGFNPLLLSCGTHWVTVWSQVHGTIVAAVKGWFFRQGSWLKTTWLGLGVLYKLY